jgi:ribosomal protein S18 acetylase RimI-like enzyme
MSANHSRIRQTEEHLMNAWPSLRTMLCDGWVFREANGYTKRANSASTLGAHGLFSKTLDHAERFYASSGSPSIFRLTPLAGDEPDRILADRGYRIVDDTIVMTADLHVVAAADPRVTIALHCDEAWERGYAAAHALDEAGRRAHRAILDRIAPLATAFATLHRDGRAIAFGLGVMERDHLGLFDIVTVPEARRQGAARALVTSLMRWGTDRDAKTAWLSVIGDNEPAKPLYAELGFDELYRYHYRVAPQQEGFSGSSRASDALSV